MLRRNPFRPTAGSTPPLLVGRDDVLPTPEHAGRAGVTRPDLPARHHV